MSESEKSQKTQWKKPLVDLLQRQRVLRVVRSPDASAVGRVVPLAGSELVLGRGVEGLGAIRDPQMSREHARLTPGPRGAYTVADLGTANGTFLDGVPLSRPSTIITGSVLAFGDSLAVLDEEADGTHLPATDDADGSLVPELVGTSFAAERIRRSIATVASAKGSILILGPNGTGKEVAAAAIHRLSPRSEGPWVPVNCAAIPTEMAEAELFGHKKGAFTGAIADRQGHIERAAGGTLFLDEIGDLPLPLQAKLLRTLEDGSIQQLGGGAARKLDFRVIAATNVDLDQSGFRQDLLARLGTWILRLPSLAQRRADILVLWDHFIAKQSADGVPHAATAEFAEALLLHDWPMNIRELHKLASRLAVLAKRKEAFDLPQLPEPMRQRIIARRKQRQAPRGAAPESASPGATTSLDAAEPDAAAETREAKESSMPDRVAVEEALKQWEGNISQVAEALGLHRTQLYRCLKRYGLDADRYRRSS